MITVEIVANNVDVRCVLTLFHPPRSVESFYSLFSLRDGSIDRRKHIVKLVNVCGFAKFITMKK